MVEHLLIGLLAAILVCGAQMIHLNTVHIPDFLIHAILKSQHRGEISRYCISGPDIRCSDPVKRKPTGFDYIQHLQAVFAVGNAGYVLGAIVDHAILPHCSAIALAMPGKVFERSFLVFFPDVCHWSFTFTFL